MKALLSRFTMTLLVAFTAGLPVFLGLFPWLSREVKVLLVILVVVGAAARDYFQNVKPHVDFLEKRRYFFDLACKQALERLRQFDDTARLNVMEIRWRLPRKRWGRFKPIYQLNMEGARDLDLRLRVDQGVAGEAVHRKEPYVGNLEARDAPSFRLDPSQQEKTKDLTLIFSVPIMRREMTPTGEFHSLNEVIGVLNIDSRLKDALAFYETTTVTDEGTTLREEIEEALVEMSLNCSWIMS